jgi:hypothetical protein
MNDVDGQHDGDERQQKQFCAGNCETGFRIHISDKKTQAASAWLQRMCITL